MAVNAQEIRTSSGKRFAAALLALWLLASPTGLVFAGPIADASAPANQRPTVTTAPTGVQMVNVAAPNASGLSYNRYQRFDVDPTGLLLNNSTRPLTSPLGPILPANPNYAGRSATLILNEVVTAIPSNLNGPLGVLGDPAKVVIANPNGITCNGCSFLNTPQVTLTTGRIGFRDSSGAASSFDAAAGITLEVGGGRILIDGTGLSSPLARLDLVSETIRVNGPVTVSGALNLLAGRQTVDADSLAILAGGTGNDRASIGGTWAIDATAFGAMNAGSIRIVATPAGLGVRSSSQLAASGSDLVIRANGDLALANATAARDIELTAAGAAANEGQILAGRNVTIAAAGLNNAGSLIDAVGGNLTLDLAGALNNANGVLGAQGAIAVTAASLDNTGGRIQAIGDVGLTLTAGDLDLSGAAAGLLAANGDLTVRAVNLANSGNFGHSGRLTLTADDSFTNTGNLGSNDLVLAAGGLFRNDGQLYAKASLDLSADRFLNTGGVAGEGTGRFTLTTLLDNRATGRLDFSGPLTLIADTVANAGSLLTQGAADLRVGSLTNDGTLAAAGTLDVTAAATLTNRGLLAGGATTTLRAAALVNAGTIQSDTGLDITAATLDNRDAIKALGAVTLRALGSFTNSGTLEAGTDAVLELGASVNNAGGTLSAVRDLALTMSATGKLRGTVAAGNDLTLHFTDYSNGAGETAFFAGRDLLVTAHHLDNADLLAGYRDLRITTSGNLTNHGQLAAGQDAVLDVAATFANTGIVETGRDLTIAAARLDNGGGTTTRTFGPSLSMDDYRYWVLTYIDDPVIQGKLFNEITPDWQWHNSRFQLLNRWSYFRDSDLNDPEFNLTITRAAGGATLNAGRHFTATVTGALTNNASTIQAGGDINITAASFSNLAAQDLYEGWVFAGGGGHDLKAYANSSAVVHAGRNVHIEAGSSTNTGNIDGSQVYQGGSLVNGLTSYSQPTPATTLPHAVIDLTGAPAGSPAGTVVPPAGARFTPLAPTLFSSAAQLALLAPVGQSYLLNLLPANLRSGRAFLMDAWLEQQALRQAALRETGQATFLAGLAYDEESQLGIDSQQRLLLYQAAAKFATEYGIKLGVALSAAQRKALTRPILWYVEQSVIGPDGKTYRVLVPKLYLPEGQLADMANIAGGVIRGNDVTLDAKGGRIENTGYIAANTLTVNAAEIVNRQRSASWGRYTQTVKGGYLEISGDRVQPGGFMSAAKMNLNAARIESISGTFLEGGNDKSAQLQVQYGGNFSQTQNIDHTFVTFHQDSSAGLTQVAAMAIAIGVAIWIGPEVGKFVGEAAGATAGSGSFMAAAGTGANAAAAGLGNVMVSGTITGVASSAASQFLTTGRINLDSAFKSGLVQGLTAGLTRGIGEAIGNQTLMGGSLVDGKVIAGTAATSLPDKLVGYTIRAGVTAEISQLAYGREAGSFGKAFTNSFVNSAAADAANWIGGQWGGGKTPVMQTLAHAGLGALSAKLTGKDPAAGAIGGATESALGNLVDASGGLPKNADRTVSNATKAIYAAAATLAGGVIANAAGRDVTTAGQAAQNSAINNYLTHAEVNTLLKKLDECKDTVCQNKLLADAIRLSNSRNPSDLLDPALAADVAAASKLLQAASNVGGGFSISSGLQGLRSINASQASVANNTPVLKAPERPTGFDQQLAPSVLDAATMQGGNILLGGVLKAGATLATRLFSYSGGFLGEGVVGSGVSSADIAVPAGANLIGAGDRLAEAVTWIKPQQGVFDVVVHGSEDAFHVLHNGTWIELDQRALATFIQKNGYAGEAIRLISCSTGACSSGAAQNLANKLGTQVIAPSDTVWIHPNGNLTIGNSATTNTGEWNTFYPGRKR